MANLLACGNNKVYNLSQINKCKVVTKYNNNTLVEKMDTVIFGSYPQSDSNGTVKEPIEWIVLDRTNDKALLLSKYVLDCKCYNNGSKDVTWETCDLKKWLNKDFYNNAFDISEQNKIMTTNLKNKEYSYNNTYGGSDTNDKIFCLSIDDTLKYFGTGTQIGSGRGTEYVIGKSVATKGTNYSKEINNSGYKLYVFDGKGAATVPNADKWVIGNSPFCLRTPGMKQSIAAIVSEWGVIDTLGIDMDLQKHRIGVRPALWVSIN